MKKITPKISEIAGIFAADGSMQKEHICFWGNITEDRDHYDKIIKPLFQNSFGIDVNPHEKQSNSVYGFYVCKKPIISYFNNYLGFPIGKKTYAVRVPKVIMNSNNPKIWSSFVRGFTDSDGCLNFDKRHGSGYKEILKIIHTYPRIKIACVSHNLILDISILLERLGIKHTIRKTKPIKINESECSIIDIKGKDRLEKWIAIVGFNNPVQQTRYEIFKKHGFVPVNTSLSQRKEILKEDISPWDFYPKRACSLAWIGRQGE
jgi:intein/homing endonuclease